MSGLGNIIRAAGLRRREAAGRSFVGSFSTPTAAIKVGRGAAKAIDLTTYSVLRSLRFIVLSLPQFPQRIRIISGLSGLMLLLAFVLPRGGVSGIARLPVAPPGEFIALWTLMLSGAVVLTSAVLPVPALFRACISFAALPAWTAVGSLPLPLPLRLSVGCVAALVCATLLSRTHVSWAQLPRYLGLGSIALLAALYLLPWHGEPPLRQIVHMLTATQDPAARFIAIYLLLPVPVALLALLVQLGSDLSALGETLAWLIFLWAPGALLIQSFDAAQIAASIATFATLLCASYGLSDPLRTLSLRYPS